MSTAFTPLNLAFAGTPAFAIPCLQHLIDSPHVVKAVFTQPDKPAGRGRQLTPSPIKQLALANQLPVFTPTTLRAHAIIEQLTALNLDAFIVVAYGHILPEALLNLPRLGCINVHASLLPRWRGAAPINAAISAGDEETGVTIMQMDKGLDTGPMLSQARLAIAPDETAGDVHDKLAVLGAQQLIARLDAFAAGRLTAQPQDDTHATYAHKLSKQQARINWQQSAEVIARQVRAYNPWPISFTTLGNTVIRIWNATTLTGEVPADCAPGCIIDTNANGIIVNTGDGLLALTQLQLPNKKVCSHHAILNAHRETFTPGRQFGV